MKSKTILIYLIIHFSTFACFGQTKYVYYFDDNLNITHKSKSVSTGMGIMENNLLKLEVLNNLTKQPVLIAFFTDSSLGIMQGLSQSFFKNGLKESEGNYESNIENGLWIKWDSTGRIIDSTIYEKGKKITETLLVYHKNHIMAVVSHINFTADTTFESKHYDDSARLATEVSFIGQKGLLKHYDKGNLTSSDSVFSRLEIEAEPSGGQKAWTQYILSRLQNNADEIIKSGEYGTCIVKFIVGKDGKIRKAEATTMKGTALAELAVTIIKNGPKWHPALQYGRAVNAYRLEPITINQRQ
jgi:antitoxin component YwqK of YwqJK toxin-antitoxin module